MQQMLDGISQWMPERDLIALVDRLNGRYTNRLPDMWELAWLYCIGSVTTVEHEPPIGNSRPDIWCSVLSAGCPVPLVADITCISDADLHKANPVERLLAAMNDQARRAGLQGAGFHISVSHVESGARGKRKVQLLIPSGPAFDDLVKRHLRPFAERVATSPLVPQKLEINDANASIVVEYKVSSGYSSGSHRSYETTLSLENNALYNRLHKKTKQLRGAPEGAVRILLVCDGGCAMLRNRQPLEGFSARQVAQHFLRRSRTLDLVLLVTVEEEVGFLSLSGRKRIRCDLVSVPDKRSPHLDGQVLGSVQRVLSDALERLPEPQLTPSNALRQNLALEWSANMGGSSQIGGDRVRISARAVLELLSGEMSYERFSELHGWNRGEGNVFMSRLASGQLISSAKIVRLEHERDDDWMEFEFGPPDPAVSIFRSPRMSRKN